MDREADVPQRRRRGQPPPPAPVHGRVMTAEEELMLLEEVMIQMPKYVQGEEGFELVNPEFEILPVAVHDRLRVVMEGLIEVRLAQTHV